MPTTAGDLAERLTSFCVDTLERLEGSHLPGWRIPRTFAGHEVGADVRADLCFTLSHLTDAGVAEVAGEPVDTVLTRLLGQVDGRSTHTFFSYRIAETLLRAGPFAGNRLLEGLDDAQRAELEKAVDSSDWLELLDAKILPRNYAAVLARCELGRHRLGLVDDTVLADLAARATAVLAGNPRRALDDSNDGIGRYDIYTADVWLFCEPLASRIGPVWADGLAAALDLVLLVGARDGSAVAWGRSVGDLSAALTLELGALAVADGHAPGREAVWLRRAADAAATVMRGFDGNGVSTAHVHRDQDSYRGPARRLQLTFDLLGKVAYAAALLRRAPAGLATAPVADAYPDGDHWISFEDGRPAGVWAHRSPGADFVVPFVGTTRSHYLPALHQPGTWEVPVDRDLPCWTPLVVAGLRRHTAGGVPASVVHEPGRVTATWDDLPVSGRGLDGDDPGPPLPGSRTVTIAVEGRTIAVDDHLSLERPPTAVSVAIPEAAGRSLSTSWRGEGASPSVIGVEGLSEWRTPTGQITAVHQLDLDPATDVSYAVRVTPALRVASTEPDHHYSRLLYRPMTGAAAVSGPPVGWRARRGARLDQVDVLHLHWPEWLAFDDLAAHEAIIERLADADVPVVWTAHNLTPHEKRPEVYDAIYAAWAAAVRGVVHHSAWGEQRMRERYRFGDDCRHRVIPHGHFGALWTEAGLPTRDQAEERLDLAPAGLRIGIVGAPRAEKLVQVVIDAVAACERDDVELVCWSLGPGDTVPDDPRITIAEPYEMAEPATYATRLATCDVLALVFDPEGDMLATGAAADAVGLGLPVLRSDWGYLVEALGDAGIPAGHTVASVAAAIDALTPDVLDAARRATAARRADHDWNVLSRATLALFEETVLGRRS